MVEQNENTTNSNDDGAPRRRGRLFGARRARSNGRVADAAPASAESGTPTDVDTPVGTTISVEVTPTLATTSPIAPEQQDPQEQQDPVIDAQTAGEKSVADAKAGTVETEAVEAVADDARADKAQPSVPDHAPATSDEPFVPRATSTLSLIFHAPVLPDIPESRTDRDEADEPDEREARGNARRRSRRRGGNGDAGESRHREEPELITEPQKIKGSTRLEAKKQRRRDGRDAGRRRQVVTEDEFLARRESVDRQMIVRSSSSRLEIGVLEDGVLAEHYVTKSHNVSLIGNVYLGKVQNVLPSMEAAFVDIGRGRNAVLYSGEVDWSAVENGNQPRRIELALKPGDKVLVQVTKDPVGHKGARLTSQISLPGRYLVYVPNGSMNGISRKLPDTERTRLKKILKEILPEHAGVIVRTAAEGATEEQLTHDVQRLTSQWETIQKKVENGHAPSLLHSEPDLLIKIVRDVFNEDFSKLIIDGDSARSTIDEYLTAVAPDLKDRVELYDGPDSFEEYRINEQIEKALDRKVWLPSGGSLVIDRTEAMTVIDVNTGKFVGSGGNLEETVTKNNLEAAEEIVRQLRLRDIGGIIVIDFIDMVLESNRDLVLRRLVECLSRDRTKHQVAEVTSLGLVQMTRKKIGVGLQESLNELDGKSADQPAEHTGGKNGRRKNRGSASSSNGEQSKQQPSQAHQITDDVKHALSRIAASTIAPDTDTDPHAELPAKGAQAEDESSAVAPSTGEAEVATRAEPKRRNRGRGGRAAGKDAAAASVEETAPQTPVREAVPVRAADETTTRSSSRRVSTTAPVASSEAVAILDIPIPVEVQRREPRKVREDASSLLDSVLQALPEPKQPGQGRNRSRRVSSGSISAPATVQHGESGDDGTVIVGG